MDGIDGLAGGEATVASSFFFLVFAWYGQSGWAVANLVVAAASMGFVLPFANFILDTTFTLFRRLIRRVTSIELLVGIACGGLWVWGKEPQNRDRPEPLASDELRSSCAKAPSRGLSRMRP